MKPALEDMHESQEYDKFVASMVEHCHCDERYRPCDGVLAGGLCDGQHEERDCDDNTERMDEEDAGL